MKNKTPPKYRKLYDKISVGADTIAELDKIKKTISENDPDHKNPSYNTAIQYILKNYIVPKNIN